MHETPCTYNLSLFTVSLCFLVGILKKFIGIATAQALVSSVGYTKLLLVCLWGGQVHLSQKGLSQSLSLHTDLCTHAQAACAYCYSCCHSARPNFTQDPVDLLQTNPSIFKDLKWTKKWATEPFLGLYHPFLYEASDFQNTYQYKKIWSHEKKLGDKNISATEILKLPQWRNDYWKHFNLQAVNC